MSETLEEEVGQLLSRVAPQCEWRRIDAAARLIVETAEMFRDRESHVERRTIELAQLRKASAGLAKVLDVIAKLADLGRFKYDYLEFHDAQQTLAALKEKIDRDIRIDPIVWEAVDHETPEAEQFFARLRSGEVSESLPVRRPGGQPQDAVNELAHMIAYQYVSLTGMRVGRARNHYNGKAYSFQKFLGEMFTTLGIDACAERYARRLAKCKGSFLVPPELPRLAPTD